MNTLSARNREDAKSSKVFFEARTMRSFRLNKIQISLIQKFQVTEALSVSSFIYQIMNGAELLQHYLFDLQSLVLKIRVLGQSNLLSRVKNFLTNLIGKVSIQSFVSRSTRQSIKLLPAI